ncbi:MAG: hypothetical protein JXN64_06750 [Spirochaetes bacterium]|nr:hypothetical protein [Spirochaetota bacterium]
MKILKYVLLIIMIVMLSGCKKKAKENKVPLDQINIDKSTNYKYIFKDVIEKERKREESGKQDPFKD